MKVLCQTCNKEFRTIPAKVRDGKGKYCCKQCYYTSKKGKKTWNTGTAKFNAKEYMREWAKSHREWIKSYIKKWKEENPEQRKKLYAYKQQWRKLNPEREKLSQQKRKANLFKSKINDFTHEQWVTMLVEFGMKCAYCGVVLTNPTQDHIIPISRGGNHTKENIVPACNHCNCRKNDLIMSEDVKSNFQLFKKYLSE